MSATTQLSSSEPAGCRQQVGSLIRCLTTCIRQGMIGTQTPDQWPNCVLSCSAGTLLVLAIPLKVPISALPTSTLQRSLCLLVNRAHLAGLQTMSQAMEHSRTAYWIASKRLLSQCHSVLLAWHSCSMPHVQLHSASINRVVL